MGVCNLKEVSAMVKEIYEGPKAELVKVDTSDIMSISPETGEKPGIGLPDDEF